MIDAAPSLSCALLLPLIQPLPLDLPLLQHYLACLLRLLLLQLLLQLHPRYHAVSLRRIYPSHLPRSSMRRRRTRKWRAVMAVATIAAF